MQLLERGLDVGETDLLADERVEVEPALEVEVDQHREVSAREAVAVPAGLQRATASEHVDQRDVRHLHVGCGYADQNERAGEVARVERLLPGLRPADRFDDYVDGFLGPRLVEMHRLLAPEGTLYLHLDYREAHYVKVALDGLFGRECFLNELIWAYDYGAKARRRWPAKHDTILVYVKDPDAYLFDCEAVDREPYMAPGLVTPGKAERGKRPTSVWWHTIVSPTGREKTGYPTQKPEALIRRFVQASSGPGDLCLDPFAGSGTLGAAAAKLGRRYLLIDESAEAVAVMKARLA